MEVFDACLYKPTSKLLLSTAENRTLLGYEPFFLHPIAYYAPPVQICYVE